MILCVFFLSFSRRFVSSPSVSCFLFDRVRFCSPSDRPIYFPSPFPCRRFDWTPYLGAVRVNPCFPFFSLVPLCPSCSCVRRPNLHCLTRSLLLDGSSLVFGHPNGPRMRLLRTEFGRKLLGCQFPPLFFFPSVLPIPVHHVFSMHGCRWRASQSLCFRFIGNGGWIFLMLSPFLTPGKGPAKRQEFLPPDLFGRLCLPPSTGFGHLFSLFDLCSA